MKPQHNHLQHALSPYLLQHAHHRVAWQQWDDNRFTFTNEQGPLLIISIGYAACHWCHVMAHECFEDDEVADYMNQHFISIKVDREERPDVDHYYMQSLVMLTGQGGWPLNIIALPDGRPVWGATYLPKNQWLSALMQLQKIYNAEPQRLTEQAQRIGEGLTSLVNLTAHPTELIPQQDIRDHLYRILLKADPTYGGFNETPKFMMPAQLDLFCALAYEKESSAFAEHLEKTLQGIAKGGVYDALGGGFSRYSVDERWHVPHFEKMAYDNGQLLHTYSWAYQKFKNPLYQDVVEETITFLIRDLRHEKGGFYSALDADSLNGKGISKEGAYYVWELKELQTVLADEFSLFKAYYNINSKGLWEEDHYVLFRDLDDLPFCEQHGLTVISLRAHKKKWKSILLEYRNQRPAPQLDDKQIYAWNALIVHGLTSAYRVFRKPEDRKTILDTIVFMEDAFFDNEGKLFRIHKEGQRYTEGLLEDYAHGIRMYLNAYTVFFDASFLEKAVQLTEKSFELFSKTGVDLFYNTPQSNASQLLEQLEIEDNVIPSSNAIMAENLLALSVYWNRPLWREKAIRMVMAVQSQAASYPRSYAYWLRIAYQLSQKATEIVVVGEKAFSYMESLQTYAQPHFYWAASTKESSLSLLKNRYVAGATYIYHCSDKKCDLPELELEKAIEKLKNG